MRMYRHRHEKAVCHPIAAAAENLDKIIVSGGRIGSQLELKRKFEESLQGEFADITV